MKKRIANKILNAVFEYKNFYRWDMPYNGSQISEPPKLCFRLNFGSIIEAGTRNPLLRAKSTSVNRSAKLYQDEKETPQSRVLHADWHTIHHYPAFYGYRLGDGEAGNRIVELFRLAQNKTESI